MTAIAPVRRRRVWGCQKVVIREGRREFCGKPQVVIDGAQLKRLCAEHAKGEGNE